jgi:hypothetical protein
MALKFNFKSKEEISATHLAFYAERVSAWVLDVDGAVEKAKLHLNATCTFRTSIVYLNSGRATAPSARGAPLPNQTERTVHDQPDANAISSARDEQSPWTATFRVFGVFRGFF